MSRAAPRSICHQGVASPEAVAIQRLPLASSIARSGAKDSVRFAEGYFVNAIFTSERTEEAVAVPASARLGRRAGTSRSAPTPSLVNAIGLIVPSALNAIFCAKVWRFVL